MAELGEVALYLVQSGIHHMAWMLCSLRTPSTVKCLMQVHLSGLLFRVVVQMIYHLEQMHPVVICPMVAVRVSHLIIISNHYKIN